MAKIVNPLAAHLDAIADAHAAGVDQTEVDVLIEIGEAVAIFAEGLAAKVNSLRDGRMVTTINGRLERRQMMAPATVAELAQAMIEGALDLLDAAPVIKTAAALRTDRPQIARAA